MFLQFTLSRMAKAVSLGIFTSLLVPNVYAQAVQTSTPVPPSKNVSEKGDEVLLKAVRVQGQKIQSTPKSIATVTGEELEKFNVNNFRDIMNRVGNVRTSWQNPNTSSVFVRGVGWAAGAGVLDPSVGINVDGVSYGITAMANLANFSDIESFSVTRGPIGTEGGKSFSVGAVNILSREPSFSPEARLALTLGQLNTVNVNAAIGGGIIDDVLAYRISVNRETADGPYDNENDTHFTWRNTDRTSVRTQFLWLPTDGVKAKLAIDYVPVGKEICENCFTFRDKTPAYYDAVDASGNRIPVNYAEDNFGKINRRWFQQKSDYTVADYYAHRIDTESEYPNTYGTRGVTLNLNLDVGNGSQLTSITGWRDYEFSQGAGSHTPFEWLRAPRGTQTNYKQASQEFKFDTKLAESLKFQAGLFYFDATFPNTGQTERYGSDGGAWYANAAQYNTLDTDAAGRSLLLNSLDGLITRSKNRLDNTSTAIYSSLIWDATKSLSLNGGLRLSREERETTSRSYIQSNGFGAELNPVSVNNVTLSGYNADTIAQKYFNVNSYSALNATQQAQVAAARAVRAGRIGALYQEVDAESYEETLPTTDLGATYRVNETNRVFVSWKHGEKAGVSQIVGATVRGGKSLPVDTEKSDSFEIGSKSQLFDRELDLNVTLYLQNIKDYIQPLYVYDEAQTQLNGTGIPAYTSALGNVPKVQTKGVEFDLNYSGIKYTNLRLSGAYTDAVYKDFKFAPKPLELAVPSTPAAPTSAYFDATGKTLPGAPKFSGNLFADFSYPLANGKVIHTNANYNYTSSYYNDPSLSRYSKSGPFGVVDLSVGIGTEDRKFDISLVVKNVFDEDTGFSTTWNAYKPGIPRWAGLILNVAL